MIEYQARQAVIQMAVVEEQQAQQLYQSNLAHLQKNAEWHEAASEARAFAEELRGKEAAVQARVSQVESDAAQFARGLSDTVKAELAAEQRKADADRAQLVEQAANVVADSRREMAKAQA